MPKNKKLKIGFVFDDTLDSYDGVAQYVKTLGKWLSEEGHDVSYLVGETKMKEWAGGKVFSLSKNQKVSFNGNQMRIPLPAGRGKIKKIIKQHRFDILHVQVPYSPFMAQKVIRSAETRTAIMGTFHVVANGVLSQWGGRVLGWVYGSSVKRFDDMVAVSSAADNYAKSAFKLNTTVLPNVFELKRFAKSAGKSNKKENVPTILFFGRLVKRKGCKEMLHAFALLSRSIPDSVLVVGGDGPERQNLEQLAKELDIKDRVKFLGFIEESEKATLMSSAHIACFPSTSGESFGIVLLEAIASGAGVVIGGDNVGYRTVLGKRPQVLVDPKNSSEFADRLSEILENESIAKELHDWQQQEVRQYDVNVVGPKVLDHYSRAIAKRRTNEHN